MKYEVDEIQVVEPDETDSLKSRAGEDRLTLITCTPYGINSHRLLVHSHRVPMDAESTVFDKTATQTQWWMWAIIGAAALILALLALWLIAFSVLFRAVALLNHGRGWGIGVGIIYAIFAVIMIWLIIANPGKSVEALVWTAGLWGVVSGITSLVLAWQLQAVRSAFSQRY